MKRCPGRMPAGFLFLLAVLGFLLPAVARAQVLLRDLVSVEGVRSNQLVGYGLVVGLQGTGDNLMNSQFTQLSLIAILERMGVNANGQQLMTRDVASVIVSATLPPFARQGTPIDVQVSCIGDAKALTGGTLMVTPLMGADGQVYAVAQGSVVVGGFTAAGAAQSIKQGVQTSGRVPGGGIVEREVKNSLDDLSTLRLALRTPDFTTANRIEQAINAQLGYGVAKATDLGTVDVLVPPGYSHRVTALLAQIERIPIRPDVPARVVIDEKSGTIVVGADVKLDPVAVTHGNLVVRVTETPQVSQPPPFSNGRTVVVPHTKVEVNDQSDKHLLIMHRAVTLQSLVDGLNALGLGPRDLIQVLNALKASGALHAELDFM